MKELLKIFSFSPFSLNLRVNGMKRMERNKDEIFSFVPLFSLSFNTLKQRNECSLTFILLPFPSLLSIKTDYK